MKYVEYKGEKLAKNSLAYALWEAKDFKKLDLHLKEVNAKYKELMK